MRSFHPKINKYSSLDYFVSTKLVVAVKMDEQLVTKMFV